MWTLPITQFHNV